MVAELRSVSHRLCPTEGVPAKVRVPFGASPADCSMDPCRMLSRNDNKDQIASVIAERFPELLLVLPPGAGHGSAKTVGSSSVTTWHSTATTHLGRCFRIGEVPPSTAPEVEIYQKLTLGRLARIPACLLGGSNATTMHLSRLQCHDSNSARSGSRNDSGIDGTVWQSVQ